jgi:hypothetical protein
MLAAGSVSAKEANVILVDALTDIADGVCQIRPGTDPNKADLRAYCTTLPPMEQRREFINAIRVEFTTTGSCAGLALLNFDPSRAERPEERSAKKIIIATIG